MEGQRSNISGRGDLHLREEPECCLAIAAEVEKGDSGATRRWQMPVDFRAQALACLLT